MPATGGVPGFVCMLLQEAGAQAPTAGGEPAGLFEQLLAMAPPIVLCIFVFYFLVLRPQKKQQQAHQRLLEGLKKNDTVRTTSGIFGKVVSIEKEKNIVVLKIDEQNNVRIRVLRSAIDGIIADEKTGAPNDGRAVQKAEVQ